MKNLDGYVLEANMEESAIRLSARPSGDVQGLALTEQQQQYRYVIHLQIFIHF